MATAAQLMAASRAAQAAQQPAVNQETGMGSAVDLNALIDKATSEPEVPAEVVGFAKAKESLEMQVHNAQQSQAAEPQQPHPPGSFTDVRLGRIVKANGTIVLPTNGYFIPQDKEEFDMLRHWVETNSGLVEFNPPADAS